MPAPFVASLCGYRNGKPNTSDANDKQSIDLGDVFFSVLGIPTGTGEPSTPIGQLMADEVTADLQKYLKVEAPHLSVIPEKPFTGFEQYGHLTAVRALRGDMSRDVMGAVNAMRIGSSTIVTEDDARDALFAHLDRIQDEIEKAGARQRDLLDLLGEESLLKLDITVSRESSSPAAPEGGLPHLVAGLSLKWTLRTDRAQDCRSQGSKLAALRRGRMPHFAAVTMELRPAMLALLGRGSGDLDCVYHLNLPALSDAIDEYCSGSARRARLEIRDKFRRLRDQRRLRDYDELCGYLATL
ncbi:NgoMIV family type II restriction endonuclease [Streptomyces abikoensis]|uniref:NgoMIV family type II restriction endonuclease n=1 Tax=Streptomyces abikoensis TaxID=97398 RepID=A0ABW7T8A2_9ACTN